MASKDKYSYRPLSNVEAEPFHSVEDAWFWFIQAQAAKNDGARIIAGKSMVSRPCEPLDILKVLDRLYRQRRLLRDHLLVLRHYGRRQYAPDPRRVKEQRAYEVWREALERLELALMQKGIVQKKEEGRRPGWSLDTPFPERLAAE